jgi:hypothetical protein
VFPADIKSARGWAKAFAAPLSNLERAPDIAETRSGGGVGLVGAPDPIGPAVKNPRPPGGSIVGVRPPILLDPGDLFPIPIILFLYYEIGPLPVIISTPKAVNEHSDPDGTPTVHETLSPAESVRFNVNTFVFLDAIALLKNKL